jgi:CRP/FNR family transcriptional regulator, anaerobic regulatory protein
MNKTDPLAEQFPALRSMASVLRSETQPVTLDAGQHICMEGNACQSLALVTKGRARVYKMGATGREITLYRVAPGESCILTTSCILGDRAFPAFAVAETPIEARVVPAATVRTWMEEYAAWRTYVFQLMAGRLGTVIATLEEVAFRSLDTRLAAVLLNRAEGNRAEGNETGDQSVKTTHEELAADLGTAREVVSRLLKDLEHDGHVRLRRGAVEIRDEAALDRQSRRAG